METRKRRSNRRCRPGAMLLAALLVCALLMGSATAAPVEGGSAVLEAAAPKPQITIQGNVVVDKGKPTGFYELALCVRTARTVTRKDTGASVTETEYAAALAAALEDGDRTTLDNTYAVVNYPFESASAAVHINLDALTAVTWGAGKPVYEDWNGTGTVGTYTDRDNAYPRGLNTKGEDQPKIFTDLNPVLLGAARSVRLDSAKPDEVTNATALIEQAQFDPNAPARRTALLTLSANTTTTPNVVYEVPTPVVVVRFAYDMERFGELDVGDFNDYANAPNESDFWVGLDNNSRPTEAVNKTALTWMGVRDNSAGAANPYADSDAAAANSSVYQSVWYAQNLRNDQVTQAATHFYYYLGAETLAKQGPVNIFVYDETTGSSSEESLYRPLTEGSAVLAGMDARWATPGDPESAAGGNGKYSFFQNLLSINEDTLRLTLVNAETYRKPTGGGNITIRLLDWDGSDIGSLVVDGGDVRAQLEDYIENNLVHPDLVPATVLKNMGGKLPEDFAAAVAGGDANAALYQNLTNSLERQYTYRGKYAYEVGGDDAVQGVDDGAEYPLTNKLDYVFTKRVNTAAAYTVAQAGGDHTETYVLPHKLTDPNMVDAALYPYVYGWAVVEDTSEKNQTNWKYMNDAAKEPDVWTTVGVGELSDVDPDYYDPNAATGAVAADKALPANLGDPTYQAPVFLADEDELWIDPTAGGGAGYTDKYAYQLSSNGSAGYFRFADFSDIDAELARCQKKNNGGPKDTLIVKAVYEPGNELANLNYQLLDKPYYNKFNERPTDNGGAYMAQISLERATSDTPDSFLRGVVRVREPVVRQDTTYDKWELENIDLGLDHNVPAATVGEAIGLSQTMFTKVDVVSGDIIRVQLSLSARQNKADYFLIEGYGANFVAGGQRSLTNYNRQGDSIVIDNFNYFVDGDSDSTDDYWDVQEYEDRFGSHGFVLYGTLNNLMQYATKYNSGEINQDQFNSYITFYNMRDANLRTDREGTHPNIATWERMQSVLCDAARMCQTVHYDDPDFWNSELNCAELNYHQLQWYILDGVLYDRATADAKLLTFCHLHAKCADLTSTKPKNWDELVAAGRDNPDYIDQLSLTEIEAMTHLRANSRGGAFGNVPTFKLRFSQAVQAGNTDWVSIQAHIAGGGDVDDFWWYDGSTGNSAPGNLSALLSRTTPALVAQTYPDGAARTTRSKLEPARTAFDANAALADQKVAPTWTRMTGNLVKAHYETPVADPETGEVETVYTHDKFGDFEEFLEALLAAVEKARDWSGGTLDPSTLTWYQVQYTMLNPAAEFNSAPDPEADEAGFWWKDGKTPLKVSSIKTLLEAVRLSQSPDAEEKATGDAALEKVTIAMLEGENFWLRKSKTGEAWSADPATDDNTLKALLQTVKDAQKAGASDWTTLQYYLAHGELLKNEDETLNLNGINLEAYYYWWKKGGEGTEVTFPSTNNLHQNVTLLMEAALRGGEFGDPKAKASVTAQITNGSFFDLLRLAKGIANDPNGNGPEKLTDLTWYADTDELLEMITDLANAARTEQGITDPYAKPAINWYQAQYWVLEKKYIDRGTSEYAALEKTYWWYDKDEKPEDKPPEPEPTEQDIIPALEAYLSDPNATAITLSSTQWSNSKLKGKTQTTNVTIAAAKKILKRLADNAKGTSYYDAGTGKLTLTWVQIQCYVATAHKKGNGTADGELLSHDDALARLKSTDFKYDPTKFPENVRW